MGERSVRTSAVNSCAKCHTQLPRPEQVRAARVGDQRAFRGEIAGNLPKIARMMRARDPLASRARVGANRSLGTAIAPHTDCVKSCATHCQSDSFDVVVSEDGGEAGSYSSLGGARRSLSLRRRRAAPKGGAW